MSSPCPEPAAGRLARLALALLMAGGAAACTVEERQLRTDPPMAAELDRVALSPAGHGGAPPGWVARDDPFSGNAYQLGEGKRLYAAMNCNGCHAEGGGTIGPPLVDGSWLYGGSLVELVATIRDGRPGGMPGYGGRLPAWQIWQVAAYVGVLGAAMPPGGAPSRSDRLHMRPAENRAPAMMPPRRRPAPPARD